MVSRDKHLQLGPPANVVFGGVHTCTHSCPLVTESLRMDVDTKCEQGLSVFGNPPSLYPIEKSILWDSLVLIRTLCSLSFPQILARR